MKLSSSNVKKILIFSQRKAFLILPYIFSKEKISCISGNETLHFSAQDRKITKIHHDKISYTSGNENSEQNFLYFPKRKLFLCFRKREPRNGYSKKVSYVSGGNLESPKNKQKSLL